MDRLVYVAASSAQEAMLAQAANTHNLANASTTGFKADLVTAKNALVEAGEGIQSRAYSRMQASGVDFTQGTINSTGRDLDVAVNGEGWIAVMGPDGGEAYTRRGDLRVNELGQMLNGAGQVLLGNSGPIALPPFTELLIGADGTLSIVPLGETPATLAVVDRIKLVNPDKEALHKGPNGAITLEDGAVAEPDAGVTLLSGSLESSNVDSVSAMVRMIELSRGYEHHVKMMKVAEDIDAASVQLMSLS